MSTTCRFSGCPNRATYRLGFEWPYIRVTTHGYGACRATVRTHGWTGDAEHCLEIVA